MCPAEGRNHRVGEDEAAARQGVADPSRVDGIRPPVGTRISAFEAGVAKFQIRSYTDGRTTMLVLT